jgi:hypothetical protein
MRRTLPRTQPQQQQVSPDERGRERWGWAQRKDAPEDLCGWLALIVSVVVLLAYVMPHLRWA